MIENTFHYEGIKWVNQNLPNEAKIISTVRPVALLKNEFAPTDWLDFYSDEEDLLKYFAILKKNKFDHILFEGNFDNNPFKNCIGKKLKQSENFQRSTRNPFNRNSNYNFSIYSFNYNMLPNCFKN